jgi:hypothetical protein
VAGGGRGCGLVGGGFGWRLGGGLGGGGAARGGGLVADRRCRLMVYVTVMVASATVEVPRRIEGLTDGGRAAGVADAAMMADESRYDAGFVTLRVPGGGAAAGVVMDWWHLAVAPLLAVAFSDAAMTRSKRVMNLDMLKLLQLPRKEKPNDNRNVVLDFSTARGGEGGGGLVSHGTAALEWLEAPAARPARR